VVDRGIFFPLDLSAHQINTCLGCGGKDKWRRIDLRVRKIALLTIDGALATGGCGRLGHFEHDNPQDAVPRARLDLLRIKAVGQRKLAPEESHTALADPVNVLVLAVVVLCYHSGALVGLS
jgi:hypothetical protein